MFKAKSTKKKNAAPEVTPPPLSPKDKLALKRQAQEAKQKFIITLVSAITAGVIFGLLGGLAIEPKVGIGVFAAIVSVILSYCYPRKALWFFLIYMPFSGTITYWIGGGNVLFQLSKDVFYIPALVALWQECRKKRLPILIPEKILPTLALLLVSASITLFFVNGLQEFLPACDSLSENEKFLRDASGNLIRDYRGFLIKNPCKDGMPFLQGLVGLKVLISYFPLIFCAYYLIDDKQKLLFFGRLLVVLAIICCCLALVQYSFLTRGICEGTRSAVGSDLFKTDIEAKCFVGGALLYSPSQGVIRLPGTFVSPWHWAWFLIGNAAITYMVAFSDPSRLWRAVGLTGMGLVFINSVICGQRIALGLVPVLIAVLLVLTGQIVNLKRFLPIALVLGLAFGIFLISKPDFLQQRIDSFVSRWNTAPPQDFIEKQFNFSQDQQRVIWGRGLGKGTNSTRPFGPVALIETFHPKLLYEVGWPGLITFMIFVSHLSGLAWQSYRGIKDPILRNFGASLWVFMLIIGYFPYWYPLDTDPVAVYYWVFAGIIFRLPKIQKQEKEQLQAWQNQVAKPVGEKKRIFGRYRERQNSPA